ncbi:MAG: transcriptional regulator [Spirosoma sp. 48-14]|nr:MAG: transcriptional regulator [Spirosoma sp. 48-14]
MSDVMKREVGLIIREARKRKSLTQKELAERIGVTKTIITNYEAGRQNLTIDTLQKVADALGAELKISIV